MKHTLTFSMTSISGDEHDAEVIFNTKEDAQKALNHIEQDPGPCHSFLIQPYREPPSMSFDDDWAMDTEGFAKLWMRVAKHGNPKLEYKMVPNISVSINIGGYGLFHG